MSLENLTVVNLQPNAVILKEYQNSIIIKTCQRTIVASFSEERMNHHKPDMLYGTEAYKFLLEVICGLRSKIIAEYEIVSQFKISYHQYLAQSSSKKDGNLIKIIEKLFKDSKEIRTNYLLGISHESYAGITRKILLQDHFNQTSTESTITLLGSGKLAEDIIKNSIKKFQINVIGRNTSRLEELKLRYGVNPIELNINLPIVEHSCIVNTIGIDTVMFNDNNFFNEWTRLHTKRIFIDLGSPSCIKSKYVKTDGVYLLNNFFEAAQSIGFEKKQKIELARIAIDALVIKREMIFNKSWIDTAFTQRFAGSFG